MVFFVRVIRSPLLMALMAISLFFGLISLNVVSAEEAKVIGISVEAIDGQAEGMARCKFCGRLIRTGDVRSEAVTIVDGQIKEELAQRGFAWRQDNDKKMQWHINVFIYRFEERIGGNYGVERPAKVSLHLHLYEEGALKKTYCFEEEQRALSENVLKLGKFLKRGGKWVRADVLSEEGIEKGLDVILEEIE